MELGSFEGLPANCQFGVYEWCMTDEWDEAKPEHKRIAHGIEVGDGIPEMRTLHDARKALKTVGFEITHEEDLAARPDVVPWYYPLEGDIWKAQTVWDSELLHLRLLRTLLVLQLTPPSVHCLPHEPLGQGHHPERRLGP